MKTKRPPLQKQIDDLTTLVEARGERLYALRDRFEDLHRKRTVVLIRDIVVIVWFAQAAILTFLRWSMS